MNIRKNISGFTEFYSPDLKNCWWKSWWMYFYFYLFATNSNLIQFCISQRRYCFTRVHHYRRGLSWLHSSWHVLTSLLQYSTCHHWIDHRPFFIDIICNNFILTNEAVCNWTLCMTMTTKYLYCERKDASRHWISTWYLI